MSTPMFTPTHLAVLGIAVGSAGLLVGTLAESARPASGPLQGEAVRAVLLTEVPAHREGRLLRWLAATGSPRVAAWAEGELSHPRPASEPTSVPAPPPSAAPAPPPRRVRVTATPRPPSHPQARPQVRAVQPAPQPPAALATATAPAPKAQPIPAASPPPAPRSSDQLELAAASLAPDLSVLRSGEDQDAPSAPAPAPPSPPEAPEPEPEPAAVPVETVEPEPEPEPAAAPEPEPEPEPTPLPPPAPPMAQVTVAEPVLWGDIDPEVSLAAIDARRSRWTACYQGALDDDPSIQGTIELQFNVTHGHVTGLAIGADGLGDRRLTKCLTQVTRLLRFDRGQGEVLLELMLTPAHRPATGEG